MTEVKMPEPDGYMPYPFGHIGCYSEDEMKQYGDDRAREALEMAAKVCDIPNDTDPINVPSGADGIELSNSLAFHIRALAKEIKSNEAM